tara:strand:+ start:781 stop:6021 length:5241 start_codon:yes stop_codon:yes gene_type:complete
MEIEELYSLLPEGAFPDLKSFAVFVNENGASAFYPLVDKSVYPTVDIFEQSLKKKDPSELNTDSLLGDGSSDLFTTDESGEIGVFDTGREPTKLDTWEDFTYAFQNPTYRTPETEADKKFDAATKRIASGLARTPLFLQEIGGSIRGTLDKDYAEFLKTMTREEKQEYYYLSGLSDFSDNLLEAAEGIEEEMIQYDTSISEDFGALKIGQAVSRLFQEASGALPSVALVLSNPFGFAMMGAGAGASKSRSIQEEIELAGGTSGLELKQTANAVGTGIAEGIFELTTKFLGGNMFKVLRQLPQEQAEYTIKKVAKEYAKGFGLEGLSETATLATESVLDALLLDDEEAFQKSWYEYMDTFLIGGVVGGGMSGGAASMARLRQKKQSAELNTLMEETRFNKFEEPFLQEDFVVDTDIETLINQPNSENFLKGTLQGQVARGEITEDQMKVAMANYEKSFAVYNRVTDLGIAPNKMNEALRLVQEKLELEELVEGKDRAAAETQLERIAEIDKRLKVISKESTGTPTQEDIQQELEKKDQQPYTLPDVIESAKEDFVVVDNRNEREKLEINEEGEGKWYIKNIRTGTLIPFKTKASAQKELKQVIKGESKLKYGEGEVIIEQTIEETPAQTTIETVIEETSPENIVIQKNKVLRRLTDEKLSTEVRRLGFRNLIKRLQPVGKIAARSANKLIKEVEKLDFSKPLEVQQTLDNIVEAFETSKRRKQVKEATDLQSKINKRKNDKKNTAESKEAAEAFLKINPKEVSDIEAYIAQAQELAQGLLPSKTRKGIVTPKQAAQLSSLYEYTEAQLQEQQEREAQIERDAFEELTGRSADELSLTEIRKILSEVEGKDTSTQNDIIDSELVTEGGVLASSLNNAIEVAKRLISNQFESGVSLFNGEKLNINEGDKKLVETFLGLDLSVLSKAEQLRALDSLTEFVTNGSTGGMQFIVDNVIGKENAETLKKEGVKSQNLMSVLTGDTTPLLKSFGVLRRWATDIATFPGMTELMFRGQDAANKFMKGSGLQTLFNSVANAKTVMRTIEETYDSLYKKKKPNGKKFNSAENIYERGLLASMRRTVTGDLTQQKKEFERKKRLINQSIQNLKRAAKTFNVHGKQAELYQQVYDKLLKDSNSIEEVENKAARVNLDAVQWITNQWAELYPELQDISLKMYNTILEDDINYTPDVISSLKIDRIDDISKPIFESPEYINNRRLYNEKTGVLKENKRINSLGDDKFISLDFDRANMNSMRKAIVNINSASAIQQLQGLIKSDSFKDIIPNDNDRLLFKARLTEYIADQRGIKYSSETDRVASQALDKIATLPIARALVSAGQTIKQFTPIVSTLFTAGPVNTAEAMAAYFNPEVRGWLKEAGYSISNRGISSEALLDSAQKSGEASLINNYAEKGLETLEGISRFGLKWTLQQSDVFTAKTTWLANYIKKMKELGNTEVTDKDFDWSTHEVNKEAGDYAQQQTDRQQNVSDSALQGALFRNRKVGVRALVQIFMPFSNFLLNMKTRALSDALTFFSKNSSTQDKLKAGMSFSAYATELAAFNYISSALTGLNYAISDAILEGMTGDEPDEEFIKKRDELLKKGRATSLAMDYFSPMPPLNPAIAGTINWMIRTIEEDEDPFQIFEDTKPMMERLGLYTIGKEVIADAAETAKMAREGVYTYTKGGEEVEYELTDEEKELMKGSAIMEVLYSFGVMPAEVKRIVAQNKKAIIFKAKQPLPKAPSYRPRKGSKRKSKRKSKI